MWPISTSIACSAGNSARSSLQRTWPPSETPMIESKLAQHLALWMVVVFVLVAARWRKAHATAGLVGAYVFDLWLIHWLTPCFYLLPWFRRADPSLVEAGLEQSVYAIAAF